MATTQVKAPPITAEQFEDFEGFPGLRNELIYGQIVMSPQPKHLHQQTSDNIQSALRLALPRPLAGELTVGALFSLDGC